MALAVQVQYWAMRENMRHNRVQESQELFNYTTNRLNQGVNQQNADINLWNAEINSINAQTNQVFANAAQRQAGAAETQARAAITQAGVAGVNALTNITNSQTNRINAGTNQRTVTVSEGLMPSQKAKNYSSAVAGIIGIGTSLAGKSALKGALKVSKYK